MKKKLTPGIIAVYKPKGPTSYDIVGKIKRLSGIKKVGHAGTLDPLARGVLVIGIGREATKTISRIVSKEKEYLAEIRLGETSTTDDLEGIRTKNRITEKPERTEILSCLKQFSGEIRQIPPVFSAVKVKGKSAFRYARKGETINLEPRPVFVHSIEIINYRWPNLKLRIVTGPGVYIRAIARDLGCLLKTGAYLKNLERTRIGEFTKKNCISIR